MEKLEYTDIYKLNPGDNVLFVTGKYIEDKLGGYYVPDIDVMWKQIEELSPKLEEMGVNAMFCLNIFADIKGFDKDVLIQMRDILDNEIAKMEKSNEEVYCCDCRHYDNCRQYGDKICDRYVESPYSMKAMAYTRS